MDMTERVESIHHNNNDIYKREDAEIILTSNNRRPLFLDPLSLPIAGLRTIHKNSNELTLQDVPQEIIPPEYRPVVLCDLDDSVWSHALTLVRCVSEATDKPISPEQYRQIGNTRNVPEWRDDPSIMEIHDSIIRGAHPEFYPFVNTAYPEAIATILSVERMGHNFAYLTARPRELLSATLRVLDWNNAPRAQEQNEFVDALDHEGPKDGYVYCGRELPMTQGKKTDFKYEVIVRWLENLHRNGWKGDFVLIDDLLNPLRELVEKRHIIGVSLEGDVNVSKPHFPEERRVHSWSEIANVLMEVHKRAVINNNSPFRLFKHKGRVLKVDKRKAGIGAFSLTTISPEAYEWEYVDDPIQTEFRRLSQ